MFGKNVQVSALSRVITLRIGPDTATLHQKTGQIGHNHVAPRKTPACLGGLTNRRMPRAPAEQANRQKSSHV
jgi:hypothetical protein